MSGKLLIDVRPRCRSDVLDVVRAINADSPTAARRFGAAFERTLRQLADFPSAGQAMNFKNDRLRDSRVVSIDGFRNWIVIYRVTPDAVEALRVVHGARDLDALDG